MDKHKNILFLMSGSIACAKATALISDWTKQGHSVRVACTASAGEFIGRATLEGLSGQPVFEDTFERGRAMDHIALAQWADVLIACPATSNLVNKFAAGIADDVVTTLWQAAWGRGIPQFVVPAMNTHMWRYPATQENVERLRGWGVHVLPTASGDLACGESGEGRMLEPAEIQQFVERRWARATGWNSGRVLVTGGGTRVPIDAVRYIGNLSTGKTAATLADTFADLGFDVTWLGATDAVRPQRQCRQERYETFTDLQDALAELLSNNHFDLVVHAAAVSDFSVQQGEGKLTSDRDVDLRLTPNPKLLNGIRELSRNGDVTVVGFKLTAGATPDEARAAVARVFARGGVDWVVQNDMQEIRDGKHRFRLFASNAYRTLDVAADIGGAAELAQELARVGMRVEKKEMAS